MNGNGWCMKDLKEKTEKAFGDACEVFYDQKPGVWGIGGSIPFIDVIMKKFKDSEIIVTGVVGPDANIHAPNETIDLPYMRKFICALSHTLTSLC
jgi:acetylornithine deacetylase/succinyl-diaminopimelate desuccinylase-like protein